MKIINHTRVDDEVVKGFVRSLTKGITRRISTITISYTRKLSYRGRIQFGLKMPMKIAFARKESGLYPITMNEHRHKQFNFPIYIVNNETELCLVVLSHENHHVRAWINHRRSTNKMAEVFAYKKLQKYREETE